MASLQYPTPHYTKLRLTLAEGAGAKAAAEETRAKAQAAENFMVKIGSGAEE